MVIFQHISNCIPLDGTVLKSFILEVNHLRYILKHHKNLLNFGLGLDSISNNS